MVTAVACRSCGGDSGRSSNSSGFVTAAAVAAAAMQVNVLLSIDACFDVGGSKDNCSASGRLLHQQLRVDV